MNHISNTIQAGTEANKKIDERFEKTKDEIATKEFVHNEIKGVRDEIKNLEARMGLKIDAKVESAKSEIIKWMVTTVLTVSSIQIAALAFILKVFFK